MPDPSAQLFPPYSATEDSGRSRRNRMILAIVLASVVGLTTVQVTIHQLRFPTPIASNILIFALVNINIVLLLLLVLLVFRSLFKVYLERRENVLGSKIRVKLAVAFVGLALLPAGLLFLVASNLITTSVDTWFNIQVEKSLESALDVAQTYSRATQEDTLNQARQIAARVAEAWASDGGAVAGRRVAGEKAREYGLDSLQLFSRQRAELVQWRGSKVPEEALLSPASRLVRKALEGDPVVTVQLIAEADLIRAVVPVLRPGATREVLAAVAVTVWVPAALSSKAEEIQTGIKEYQQLRMLKNPIKGIYLMLFLMVTLAIIFGAIWVGVYLARGITGPIQELAEGTRKIAAGDLSFRVQVKADDEIGMLVESFNKMTEDLGKSKLELTQGLRGVAAVQRGTGPAPRLHGDRPGDHHGRRALAGCGGARQHRQSCRGAHAGPVAGADPSPPVCRGLRRVHPSSPPASGGATRRRRAGDVRPTGDPDLERSTGHPHGHRERAPRSGRRATRACSSFWTTSPRSSGPSRPWPGGRWPVASPTKSRTRSPRSSSPHSGCGRSSPKGHPTCRPCSTSAREPSFRRWRGFGTWWMSSLATPGCPAPQPRPGDLHQVIQQVAQLYAGIRPGITLGTELDPAVPQLNLDPDQMKRALINLVDNAVAALGEPRKGPSASPHGTLRPRGESSWRLPIPVQAFRPKTETGRSCRTTPRSDPPAGWVWPSSTGSSWNTAERFGSKTIRRGALVWSSRSRRWCRQRPDGQLGDPATRQRGGDRRAFPSLPDCRIAESPSRQPFEEP